ncbi:MAG: hypothetical protein K0R09_2452 [Clostridiales bacterium]|jgi:preprotein translocase subunit SecA|nr:hypothetical protein [Clostridiales bacterium]
MSLFSKWEELAEMERNEEEYEKFWEGYFKKEENNYKYIIGNKINILSGTIETLAKEYNMDLVTFTGFIHGINTSLNNPVDMDSLTEDTELKLEIDFEKLYFNMHVAKADWLYNITEWDGILSQEKREEIEKDYKKSKIVVKEDKIGRNDPCPCGSGKKYKKCCGKN